MTRRRSALARMAGQKPCRPQFMRIAVLLGLVAGQRLPEKPTVFHRDGVRIERIDRIGLELGTQYKT